MIGSQLGDIVVGGSLIDSLITILVVLLIVYLIIVVVRKM